jgi:hypothetical protein
MHSFKSASMQQKYTKTNLQQKMHMYKNKDIKYCLDGAILLLLLLLLLFAPSPTVKLSGIFQCSFLRSGFEHDRTNDHGRCWERN